MSTIIETIASKIKEIYPTLPILLGFNNINKEEVNSFPYLLLYGKSSIVEKDIRKTIIECSYVVSNSGSNTIGTLKTYTGFTDICTFSENLWNSLSQTKFKSAIPRLSNSEVVYDVDFPIFTARILFTIDEKLDYYR